jgi:hypothetical protein
MGLLVLVRDPGELDFLPGDVATVVALYIGCRPTCRFVAAPPPLRPRILHVPVLGLSSAFCLPRDWTGSQRCIGWLPILAGTARLEALDPLV